MIQIKSLRFEYQDGEFTLRMPEFAVSPKEKVAIIGPSGSGKSTLLNIMAGIALPREGTVRVGDVSVHRLSDAERRDFRITSIGFVFQEFELLDYLNVLDNILHPYRITGSLKLDRAVRDRAVALAGSMDIGDKLGRFVGGLSQGERQRAAICRALLPEPQLILADEPTGNLDPANKILIMDLLAGAVDDHGATLVAVTHDHDLLPRFDRVVDLRELPE